MRKRLGRVLVLALLLSFVAAGSACNKSKKDDAVGQGTDNGGPPAGMFGGPGRQRGPIHQAMTKLFRGPQSLKDSIGQELASDAPTWETIQPQAKEFAELAASLKNYDPPKGDKDSWTKQTTSFSESASALEHAADAKKKEDAKAAYETLTDKQTCNACHQTHKGGPGGMRRPSGPPS